MAYDFDLYFLCVCFFVLQIILSSPRYIEKSMEYQFVKPWLNEGLLISTGKKWYERRKIITPAFHFKILEQFVEVFDRLGTTVVEKLKTFDAADDVEFYPIAVLYTLDVMCGELYCDTFLFLFLDLLRQTCSLTYPMSAVSSLRYNFCKKTYLKKRKEEEINFKANFIDRILKCKVEWIWNEFIANQNKGLFVCTFPLVSI